MEDPVKLIRDAEIAAVLLNRPQAYNALDLDLLRRFSDCLIALSADAGVKGVVISGEGKAFCAGGDLRWGLRFPGGTAAGFHELAAHFHQAILEIRRMPKPVIGAVNGVAAGGGFSLALACDFRVMARSATLRQAYTSSGLSIDGGGSFTLPRLVGFARALEIMAFDRPIPSDQALAWGLATKVVEDGAALDEALRMARDLSKRSIHSFGWSKQLMTDSFHTPLEVQLERERAGIVECVGHPDGKEGLLAFSEKRTPQF